MPSSAVATLVRGQTVRQKFIHDLKVICGNTVFLWLPQSGIDGTTTREDATGRILTWDATMAGRLTAQGKGWIQSFDVTNWGSTPDTGDMSFGNSTIDFPFSIFAVLNPTSSAADRVIVSKFNTAQGEFTLRVTATTNLLSLLVRDESAAVNATRDSSGAITVGALSSIAATYDGTGGATAMNGALLYQNGAAVTSTATNNASYVAIEDLASATEVGSRSNHGSTLFLGSIGLIAICRKTLTAAEVAALHTLVKAFFNF